MLSSKGAEPCEAHPRSPLNFLCTTKACNQILCAECIYTHCKEHEKSKTYPEIKSVESVKQGLCDDIVLILKSLYQELEDLSRSSQEKLTRSLDNAEEEVISVVQDFFREKKEDALKQLEATQEASNKQIQASQLKTNLQNKIFGYEELNNEIQNSHENIRVLEKISERDLQGELKEIVDEIAHQIRPITLWKSASGMDTMRKLLEGSYMVGKISSGMVFPPDKRDSDIEVIPGSEIVLKKKMEKNTPSICLGEGLSKGIHKFTARIDSLAQGPFGGFQGWVGMGFIENDQINYTVSNYSQASCICSDQSFYKLQIVQTGQVAVGVCYSFELNFETGELKVVGDNGLEGRAEGFKGKTVFPFFEFTNKHQITILNYTSTQS